MKEWAVKSAETTLSLKKVKLDLTRVRDVEHLKGKIYVIIASGHHRETLWKRLTIGAV